MACGVRSNCVREYDDQAEGKRSPFWIDDLKPIQVATFDVKEYAESRRRFTNRRNGSTCWIRTIGLEPAGMNKRLKLLYLLRLVPLTEQNHNLAELGP